ncbi:response regulator [Cesiribacter andamanensis]|uniref:Response regulator rcp1 n=1 Tax=Cesiribacter andamanensis AMV16 TaxID=1279009 RepID=M7N8J2_9BACT|nr:response regulator [Cesiribacter andamanensis]EMR03587.1 Response regulator rcp1 [Cesiribacter andamanensis AMV16]
MAFEKVDTIILVDDDPITCYLNAKLIEGMGYEGAIVELCSGEAALDYLRKTRSPENKTRSTLILLDINMPEMNGFEFLQELRVLQAINKEKLGVAILSSSTSQKDQDEATRHVLAGYLTKPLLEEELLEILQSPCFI